MKRIKKSTKFCTEAPLESLINHNLGAFEFLCVCSQENKMAATINYVLRGHKELEDYALIYHKRYRIILCPKVPLRCAHHCRNRGCVGYLGSCCFAYPCVVMLVYILDHKLEGIH